MEQQLKMFRTGQELKREGIKKAETHANSVHKNWSEKADEFLKCPYHISLPCRSYSPLGCLAFRSCI